MYAWVYLHFVLYAIIVIAGIAMSEIVRDPPRGFVTELGGLAIGAFLLVCGACETVLLRKADEPTHPVRSPALKIACAPIAAVSGYVATGGAQLAWMFGALLVPMIYGLYVWFTQELDEHAGEHSH